MDKKTLRRLFQNERDAMEPRIHKMLNFMLMESLKDVLSEHNIKRLGVYYPIRGEVDVRELKDIYELYYPKIEGDRIVFYKDTGEFEKGPMGTYEPKSDDKIEKDALDAVIVPGLVYDYALYRLGYGKGYYDGFLRDYKGLSIGVCFERFRMEALPSREHDIPVDLLVTDNQVYESRHEDV